MSNEVQTPSIVERILAATAVDVVTAPPALKPVDEEKTAKPPMYAVLLHNDNTTNPTFVTRVLVEAFSIPEQAAQGLMMTAHHSGKATVQIVTREVAETRLQTASVLINSAREGLDFFVVNRCELTFSIKQETKGGE